MANLRDELSYFFYAHPRLQRTFYILSLPLLCPCYCINEILNIGKCGTTRAKDWRRHHDKMHAIHFQHQEQHLKKRKSVSDLRRDRIGREKAIKMQQASPLFAKLPAELRIRIYEMVLSRTGAMHVRTTTTNAPIFKFRQFQSAACVEGEQTFFGWHSQCWKWPRRNFRSLLLTCRLMYAEAIHILYSGNMFQFVTNQNFILFSMSIPQARLNTIRKLQIDLLSSNDNVLVHMGISNQIQKTISIVSRMRCLRDLQLIFGVELGFWSKLNKNPNFIDDAVNGFEGLREETGCRVWVHVAAQSSEDEPLSHAYRDWLSYNRETRQMWVCGKWPVRQKVLLPWTDEDAMKMRSRETKNEWQEKVLSGT